MAGLVSGTALDTAGGRSPGRSLGFYAGSIVLCERGRTPLWAAAALVMAVAMLVYPGYAGMFHELGAEMVFGLAFAGWAFLVCRALSRPATGRFVALGLGIALLR